MEEVGRQRDEVEDERVQDRTRYITWIAGTLVGGSAIALVLWVVSRRSVAIAKQDRTKAEMLVQSAQADLAARHAKDRLAKAVPAVFLDGADSDGRSVAIRVPGDVIAGAAGAVVGRNPFDSAVVLDHDEVSRRHFRLFAQAMSVLVEDLNSTNGTKLNDVTLVPGAGVPLQHGAVLQVGSLTLNVTLQP